MIRGIALLFLVFLVAVFIIILSGCSTENYELQTKHIHPSIEKCPELSVIESNNIASTILDNTSKYYLCSKQVDIIIQYYELTN